MGTPHEKVVANYLLGRKRELEQVGADVPSPARLLASGGPGRANSPLEDAVIAVVGLVILAALLSFKFPNWPDLPIAIGIGIAAGIGARQRGYSFVVAFALVSVPFYFLLRDFGGVATRVGPWVGYGLLALLPLLIIRSSYRAFRERPVRSLLITGMIATVGVWIFRQLPPLPTVDAPVSSTALKPRSITSTSATYSFEAPAGAWSYAIVMPASATSMRLRSDSGVQLRMSIDGRETPYETTRIRPGHSYRFMSRSQRPIVAELIVATNGVSAKKKIAPTADAAPKPDSAMNGDSVARKTDSTASPPDTLFAFSSARL